MSVLTFYNNFIEIKTSHECELIGLAHITRIARNDFDSAQSIIHVIGTGGAGTAGILVHVTQEELLQAIKRNAERK